MPPLRRQLPGPHCVWCAIDAFPEDITARTESSGAGPTHFGEFLYAESAEPVDNATYAGDQA